MSDLELHAGRTSASLSENGHDVWITPTEAIEMAVKLARWGTNPQNIRGLGVVELRKIAGELDAEADRRETKR